MTTASAHSVDPILLENRLLELSSSRSFFALYTSQGYDSKWGEYELLFAWGAKAVFDTDALKNGALDNGWRFGFLGMSCAMSSNVWPRVIQLLVNGHKRNFLNRK